MIVQRNFCTLIGEQFGDRPSYACSTSSYQSHSAIQLHKSSLTIIAVAPLCACRSHSFGLGLSREPIDPNCIFLKELFLVHFTRAASKRHKSLYPLSITGRKRTNRPVTPEHYAVPAEAFYCVINVGTQIFRGPVMRIRIGN